ncbi:MAG: hypothetical protein NZL92_06035 [Gloeomargarita sp. SKYG116]|nr:hypothetical protein [Gloeomargarita sp. SKYG116]MCS7226071.1 hypothetical protein [Gloeomargarita sp. SKYB31]MDW8401238.1 hypothetical protein [Gloeomargarita sp. SKYGB_i_bin116]
MTAGMVAGACLWAIAFYWGFATLNDWLYERLAQRLPAAAASLVGVLPLLAVGGLCEWVLDQSLGKSWGVSCALLAAVGAGVYALGRRSVS